MINFYKVYNRSDLDNNEYSHSLEIFDNWWVNDVPLQLSDIENILHFIKYDVSKATEIAQVIIKDRWPEAELVIKESPRHAARYARYVMHSRWLEAEPYIMKNEKWWNEYKTVFKI